jgi:DNA (cytosine-5)-methyltransferase 1
MNYLSICSGIEAATTAWHSLGWTPIGFSEIEPFPSAVLAHHWPHVRNYGDMTRFAEWDCLADADLLVGGTPCQAFSVAGLRNSLDDARGNLTLTYVRMLNEIDEQRNLLGRPAAVCVWENVPGVLSTKDNAFGCFLGGLAGSGGAVEPPDGSGRWANVGYVRGPRRSIAWRVLDAQYFGVAQRRRRVFVVASADTGFRPESVLFECEGVRRDTPPRREAGKGHTGYASVGIGEYREGVGTLRAKGGDCAGGSECLIAPDVANCLQTTYDDYSRADGFNMVAQHMIGGFDYENNAHGPDDATGTLLKGSPSGGGRPLPAVCFEPRMVRTTGGQPQEELSHCLRADANGGDGAPCVAFGGDIARTLSARHDSSPCADRGMDVVAVQTCRRCGGGEDAQLDPSRDYLKCPECGRRVYEVQSFRTTGNCGAWATGDKTDALTTATDPNAHVLATQTAVRRLTPEECETLQGFPQSHTRIPWRNHPADACPDGPRYKAIGNSMAVPCMAFIGERIARALT